MPRKKCYGSEAEKQRAYRLRKAGLVLVEKEDVVEPQPRETDEVSPNNLPVLAEPGSTSKVPEMEYGGEAREGTPVVRGTAATSKASDSRGGQNLSKTDQLMIADHLGGDFILGESHDRQCLNCNSKFSTRLELNKFCCPKCRGKYIRNLVTMSRK